MLASVTRKRSLVQEPPAAVRHCIAQHTACQEHPVSSGERVVIDVRLNDQDLVAAEMSHPEPPAIQIAARFLQSPPGNFILSGNERRECKHA